MYTFAALLVVSIICNYLVGSKVIEQSVTVVFGFGIQLDSVTLAGK